MLRRHFLKMLPAAISLEIVDVGQAVAARNVPAPAACHLIAFGQRAEDLVAQLPPIDQVAPHQGETLLKGHAYIALLDLSGQNESEICFSNLEILKTMQGAFGSSIYVVFMYESSDPVALKTRMHVRAASAFFSGLSVVVTGDVAHVRAAFAMTEDDKPIWLSESEAVSHVVDLMANPGWLENPPLCQYGKSLSLAQVGRNDCYVMRQRS